MNGIMNENQLTIVKKFEAIKPLIQKIDFIFDNCYRECHIKHFHTFKYRCIYNSIFTNIRNSELINLPVCDKNRRLFEVTEKLKIARQRGFIFIQINKLTINFSRIYGI